MTRPPITRVRLVTSASAVDTSTIAAEFPTIKIELGHAIRVDDAVIDADAWRTSKTFEPFDEAVARSRGDGLMVRGDRRVELVAVEALTRYQRFIERKNGSSRTPIFGTVLRAHRALHDVTKPLVEVDLDHTLDTWQWMLRIDATASITAQLAALLHDVERLESEPDVRIEHHAADYQAFEDAHASRGGAWAFELLQAAGVAPVIAERVREIVTRRGRDPEIDLLNDADALSFMSLNSSAYLDHFGPEETRRKLVYTLGRMGDRARKKLAHVRLRPDVRALYQRAVAA
jgi:hypothetical protein